MWRATSREGVVDDCATDPAPAIDRAVDVECPEGKWFLLACPFVTTWFQIDYGHQSEYYPPSMI